MNSSVYIKVEERIQRLEGLRRLFRSAFSEGVPMPLGSLFPQILIVADIPFPPEAVLIWSKAFPYYGLDWEQTAQLSWIPQPQPERRQRYLQRLVSLLEPAGVLILGTDPKISGVTTVVLPNTVFAPLYKKEFARGIRRLAKSVNRG